MPRPDVTLCIPTWQAEPFIARTLECARAQTHRDIRILVSIDASGDRTEAICREHAARDRRIDVIVQHERLGWSANANALLDRVDTPFCSLYFHDDIIEPDYTRLLRQALLDDPQATSAHCDLGCFGNHLGVEPGNDYHGSACRRLLNFMAGPVKSMPLSSLVRTQLLHDGLRFPQIGGDGFWRCHPFLFQLLAAGPARHVPQVLYHRWYRDGSMSTTWNVSALEVLIEGQRASAGMCARVVDAAAASEDERALLHYALYLFVMIWTRRNEVRMGGRQLIDPARIRPQFANASPPAALAAQPANVQQWLRDELGRLRALEQQFATQAQRAGGVVVE